MRRIGRFGPSEGIPNGTSELSISFLNAGKTSVQAQRLAGGSNSAFYPSSQFQGAAGSFIANDSPRPTMGGLRPATLSKRDSKVHLREDSKASSKENFFFLNLWSRK